MRFELRYHNGLSWTADVSTNGSRFVDPSGTSPSIGPGPGGPSTSGTAKNGAATAALVLGISSIVVGWMPVVVVIGAIAAVLAIVLGVAGRKRAKQSGVGGGFALAGLITGSVGVVACVGGVLFTASMFRAIDRFDHPESNEASITSCTRTGDDMTAIGELTNLHTEPANFSVRVYFVRTGTDNPRRQVLIDLGRIAPGETASFEAVRPADLDDLDCIVGAVRGPLPYGVDPGT